MLSASSCIISHLPRNPVRGGRPAKDKVVIKVRVVNQGAKFVEFLRFARFRV